MAEYIKVPIFSEMADILASLMLSQEPTPVRDYVVPLALFPLRTKAVGYLMELGITHIQNEPRAQLSNHQFLRIQPQGMWEVRSQKTPTLTFELFTENSAPQFIVVSGEGVEEPFIYPIIKLKGRTRNAT